MSVAEYVGILRRNVILIITMAILGGLGSLLYAQTISKQYRSYASVMVIPERGESPSEIVQGANYVQNIVQSYAVLATTPYVLQPVIDELGLSETSGRLAQRVSVETPLNTVVIQLAVTADAPEEAQKTASAITDSLISAVAELSPMLGNKPAVHLQTISPASLPQSHVSPDNRLYTAAGAIAGLVLALAISFLREQLRSRPRNSDDVAAFTDVPVLGSVPTMPRSSQSLPNEIIEAPDAHVAESLRAIAASLRFVSIDKPAKVIIVTSARPSDGKTSIATALGLTLAEAGNRTLVLDADLRKPSVADLLGVEGAVGLTTVLLHDCAFQEAVQPWGHRNLSIMAGGTLAPNPGQLVSSGELTDVIAEARRDYDAVIIDTSPVVPVSDALWLAPLADGVIIVGRARRTPIRAIQTAIESVKASHAVVLGLVLNATKEDADSRYHGVNYGQYEQVQRRPKLPKWW